MERSTPQKRKKMKHRILGPTFVFLFLFASHAHSQNTVEVTYIANEGFMVEIGETKILLDALFGGLQGDWADQPDEAAAHKLVTACAVACKYRLDLVILPGLYPSQNHCNPTLRKLLRRKRRSWRLRSS